MTTTLKEMAEQGMLCNGRGRAVVGCKGYGYDFCRRNCAYAEKILNPEEEVIEMKEMRRKDYLFVNENLQRVRV